MASSLFAPRDRSSRRWRTAGLLLAVVALAGCSARTAQAPTNPELATTAAQGDPLALCDALEALIDQGRATSDDRAYAFEVIRTQNADTAAAAYARASITGRLVQDQGLRASKLVPEVEAYALRSRELDPEFRGGTATLLLGKLYVTAPASLLEHGDSETGIELLEELTAEHPDVAANHLRLAEAYVTLHDPEPAGPHLCFAVEHKAELRPEDQQVLTNLLDDVGQLQCAPGEAPQ